MNSIEEKNDTQVKILELIIRDLDLKNPVGLAKSIGMLPSNISTIMNSKTPVPKNMGQKLESTFGISKKWFDTGIGEFYLISKNGLEISEELKSMALKLRAINKAIGEEKDAKEKDMLNAVSTSTPSVLGARLKLFIVDQNLSQITVSRDTKTPPSTISKYIKGTLLIPTKFIKKLGSLYNLNYKWFYNGTGSKTNTQAEKKQLITDMKTLNNSIDLLTAKLERAEEIIEKLVADFYAKK